MALATRSGVFSSPSREGIFTYQRQDLSVMARQFIDFILIILVDFFIVIHLVFDDHVAIDF